MLQLLTLLEEKKDTLVVAESLTGGLIASHITSFPGVSKVFWGGFIAYSNMAKNRVLGIPMELINKNGAVSKIVALEMAKGSLDKSEASFSLGVTGFAGPSGDKNMIGRVYIAVACRNSGNSLVKEFNFTGGRSEIRESTLEAGIAFITQFIINRGISA